MQYLIDFAQEDGEFRQILERAAEYDTVQGVVIDLDRYWISAWQMAQEMGAAQLRRWEDDWSDLFHLPFPMRFPFLWRTGEVSFVRPRFYSRPIDRRDIEKWRPRLWSRYCDNNGLRDDGYPIVVRVCLRPRKTAEEAIPAVEDLKSGEGRLRVEVATRSQAILSANPRRPHRPVRGGISIGVSATDFGTLGVVLEAPDGRRYGLTCSHVAAQQDVVSQPARRDSSKAAAIGQSILATSLSACSANDKCNPWSGVSANEIDASLIAMTGSTGQSILEVLDIGPLNGVVPRSSLSTDQAIEVTGRTSRYNTLVIGGLAAWYRLKHGTQYYCFRNLFEVRSPYGATKVIRSGDSGAPVCTANDDGIGWCGMIVGCDTFQGYAMYSESIESWWVSQGRSLRLA